ncbi:hypothetical protein ACWG8W_06240 [Citricoccus zhacaiensis]
MTTETKSKRITQKDVDALNEEILAENAAAIREARTSTHSDPEAVATKWQETEELLMPHQFKQVVEGWTLEGWKIEPSTNASSLYPLVATIHFRHSEHVGYDAAYEWGVEGGQAAYAWLQEVGFPFGEVEAVLV